jgi:hypothetical protein
MRALLLLALLLLVAPAYAQTTPQPYAVILTSPMTEMQNGATVILSTGTVLNVILWDGVSSYAVSALCPGSSCELKPAGTLQIGQVTTP